MKKVLLVLSMLLLMAACDDFLDEQPISALSAETFWKSPDDVRAGLASMYDAFQKAMNNNYFDWGEGRADNFTAGGTGQFQVDIAIGNLSSTIGAASWESLYRVIGIANFAIKYIPEVKDLDAKTRDHYLSQAYAMRAICYFYAVRVWGDVPVWLTPYEKIEDNPRIGQTPANEVLNNVILADLNTAYTLVDKAVTGVWDITVGGILAITTDVHMWMKNYQAAIDASQLLIALNRYSLETSTVSNPSQRRANIIAGWKKIFTDPAGTKEAIWSLHWNFLQDGGNGIGSRTGNGSNTSQFEIDDPLQSLFEANATSQRDIRRGQTYDTLKVTTNIDKIWKYYVAINGVIQYQTTAQCEAKLPLYRFADILLLRAEAYARLGNGTAALTALNQIRTRAQLPNLLPTDVPTLSTMETAILQERQLEFVSEGKRWFDLVRTDRAISVMDPILRVRQQQRGLAVTGFGDPARIRFPIHRDILNENNLLVQNEGYN
ncbi:MAG: RagB/SusD family nutrient uptake outer membrane protein [Bacteroidota bacterium]